jgi:hypothetical protein
MKNSTFIETLPCARSTEVQCVCAGAQVKGTNLRQTETHIVLAFDWWRVCPIPTAHLQAKFLRLKLPSNNSSN